MYWLVNRLPDSLLSISPDARQLRDDHLTYLSKRKLVTIESELRRIGSRPIPGDIVEFGVALGGSAILLAKSAQRHRRRFFGYDVFGMIPAPTSDKDDEKSRRRYQTISTGQAKGIAGEAYYGYIDNLYDQVCATFARYGLEVDGQSISLVKGLFNESWPENPVPQIALAHIDCDWYEPVRFCLEAVADRIAPGGAIILDDYFDYGGCRTATDEFLLTRSDYRRHEGRNLLLRRVAG